MEARIPFFNLGDTNPPHIKTVPGRRFNESSFLSAVGSLLYQTPPFSPLPANQSPQRRPRGGWGLCCRLERGGFYLRVKTDGLPVPV